MRRSCAMEEGWGPKTVLREMLLTVSGAKDANDLLHRLYTPEFPRPTVASWSHLIDDAAEHNGDASAPERSSKRPLRNISPPTFAMSAVYPNLLSNPDDRSQLSKIAHIGGVFEECRLLLLETFREA